jgi:hypothetical protein
VCRAKAFDVAIFGLHAPGLDLGAELQVAPPDLKPLLARTQFHSLVLEEEEEKGEEEEGEEEGEEEEGEEEGEEEEEGDSAAAAAAVRSAKGRRSGLRVEVPASSFPMAEAEEAPNHHVIVQAPMQRRTDAATTR